MSDSPRRPISIPPIPGLPKDRSQWAALGKWMWGRLVAGLFVALPMIVTVWVLDIVYSIVNSQSQPLVQTFATYFHDVLPSFMVVRVPGTEKYTIPLVGFFLTILFLILLGVLVGHWVGQRLVDAVDRMILKIPVASIIYSAAKQLMDSFQLMGRSADTRFSKVVFVQYPGTSAKLIGFLIRTFEDRNGQNLAAVFLPTAPNPLTGFMLLMPESDVEVSDMPIDEASKLIVSIGFVAPKQFTFPENKQFRIEFTRP